DVLAPQVCTKAPVYSWVGSPNSPYMRVNVTKLSGGGSLTTTLSGYASPSVVFRGFTLLPITGNSIVVASTWVKADSVILVQDDESLGPMLGATCDTSTG